MFTSLTIIIIIITCVVSLTAFFRRDSVHKLEYNPYLVFHRKEWFRIISHAFVHADFFHLFINMWVLFIFGMLTETYYHVFFEGRGKIFYLFLYLGGILFSILPAMAKHKNNPSYNAVGASGAVSAVLFASILFRPMSEIYIMFIPIGIPAFIFGILYLVYEAYMERKAKDNIAHDAHLWGALFGIVFTLSLKPKIAVIFFEQIFSTFG